MTAIVAGQGLGLINTSLGLLGGQGQIGSASQGASGEKVVVNAATGNLVIQQQDEWLVGIGPDVGVVRTYNSLAASADDDNGDNWRLGLSRKVIGTYGGAVTRVAEDGNRQTFTYNGNDGTYTCLQGGGSVDTLRWEGVSGSTTNGQWVWTDGDTGMTETYETLSGSEYRLALIKDPDGNNVVLAYDGVERQLVKFIYTYKSGDSGATEMVSVLYDETPGKTRNITSIKTLPKAGSGNVGREVTYQYDTNNRLQRVTVDLTPEVSSDQTADRQTYITQYDYVGSTRSISKMEQGTLVSGAFVASASVSFTYNGTKVETITEVVAGVTQTTTLTYGAASGGQQTTTVKDALNQVTELTFDASGTGNKDRQLLGIKGPAVGGVSQETLFTYDASGNVTSVKDARGNTVVYRYDGAGNRIYERDAQGNVVERSFSGTNKLLTETVYNGLYADGSNPTLATDGKTTRYVYDAKGHLRFVISPEGRVTEHQYDPILGQRTATLQYDDASSVSWEQDFSANAIGLTLPVAATPAGVYWTSYGGAGALKVETKPSATRLDGVTAMPTDGEYPTARTDSKPLGATWKAEFTLPANTNVANLIHLGLESGDVSTGNYKRCFLLVSGGRLKLASYTPPNSYPTLADMGAADASTKYVLEIATQSNGDTQIYVYKSGQSRASSAAAPVVNMDNGTGTVKFSIIGYRNVSNAAGDVYIHKLGYSLTPASAGLSTWRQDFESGVGGITLPNAGIAWGTDNGDGVLKITSSASGPGYPMATTAYQPLGATWRTEFKLPGTLGKEQVYIGLESGTQGQADYKRSFLFVNKADAASPAQFKLSTYVNGFTGATLGDAVAGKTYVAEFETQADGTTRVYLYESGKDRSSGYSVQTSLASGTGTARMAFLGSNVAGVADGDTLVRSLSYTMPTAQGALTNWLQDFGKDAGGFSEGALPAAMVRDAATGMLKVSSKNTTATTTSYPAITLPVQPLGSTWRAEVTTGTAITSQLLTLGIDAGTAGTAGYRRAHIMFTDGKIQLLTSPAGTSTVFTDLVATAKTGTTYVLEFASQADGSVTVFVYEKAAGRVSAVSGTANLSGAGQPLAKFSLKTSEGSSASNTDIWVDNLGVGLLPTATGSQQVNWLQDFKTGMGGLQINGSNTVNGTSSITWDSATQALKVTNVQTSSSVNVNNTSYYPAALSDYQPWGTSWRSELTLPATTVANQVYIGLETSSGDTQRRMYLHVTDGRLKMQTYRPAMNGVGIGYTSQDLGAYTPGKTYVVELITQADGGAQMYVYERGLERSKGVVAGTSLANGTGVANARFVVVAQCNNTSDNSYVLIDNLSLTRQTGEAELAAWAATQRTLLASAGAHQNISRTDYEYDFRGQVAKVKTYEKVAGSAAEGVATGKSETLYTYDQEGNLLTRTDGRGNQTSYTYDGLNRIKLETTALPDVGNASVKQKTTTVYNDETRTATVTQANGLITVSTYDQKGNLLSVENKTSAGALGTTTYVYDKLNRLAYVQASSGEKTYYVYDEASRKVGQIDAEGYLTEFVYNKANQVSVTKRYKNVALTANIPANGQEIKLSGASGVRPAADGAQDRITYNIYDKAGRLAKTVDAVGTVVELRYDGAGRVTDTIAYAKTLTSTQLGYLAGSTLELGASNGKVTYNSGTEITLTTDPTNDRRERNFYGADGLLIGKLDAEGYYTQNVYDKLGRLSTSTRLANKLSGTLVDGGTPPAVVSQSHSGNSGYILTSAKDETTRYFYNARNQLIGQLDSENFYTAYRYDAAGNKSGETRYANRITDYAGGSNTPVPVATTEITNKVLQSSSFSASPWTADKSGTGVTPVITGGLAAPDGSMTASRIQFQRGTSSDNDFALVTQLFASPTSGMSTTSMWVKSNTGAEQKILLRGDVAWASYKEFTVGTQWTRIQVSGTALAGIQFGLWRGVGSSPTSADIQVWGAQNEPGTAPTDYIPTTDKSAGTAIKTNYVLQSQSLGSSPWAANAGNGGSTPVVTANAGAAPDGTSTATRVKFQRVATYGDDFSVMTQLFSSKQAGQSTNSVWVKSSTGAEQKIVLRGYGDWSTYKEFTVGAQWTRIQVTGIGLEGFQIGLRRASQTSADILIWGAQNESGAAATDYIATGSQQQYVMRPQDIRLTYEYDEANRLKKTYEAQGGVTTTTQQDYDNGGNIRKVTRAQGTTEARVDEKVYDALGRVTEELSPEGYNAVATYGSGVRSQYLTKHTYDSAGRRTSTTEPDGLGGALKTVFYYDKKGQLTYSINALGEVVRYAYNSFGQQTTQVRMNGKVTAANYVAGGLFSALSQSLKDALTNLDNQASNNKVEQVFDQRGLVKSLVDAYGTTTQQNTYNAFGQLLTQTLKTDADATSAFTYDRRGQLKQTDEYAFNSATVIERTTKATYDAFGRVLTRTDGMNGVTTYTYDQHGRQVTVMDRTTKGRTVTTYDAFMRVMSVQDQMGQTTTYAYDPATFSVKTTTPEGVETTTTRNRHGEVVSVTDGRGNATTYSYNLDGQLKSTKVADGTSEGITTSTTYDKAGHVFETKDALGTVTRYTYDSANRVLTRTQDPDGTGLKIQTTYRYDAKGQATWMQDANGTWTKTEYDLNGRVKYTEIDPTIGPDSESNPAGLGLRTEYTYDAQGQTLTVIQGANKPAEALKTKYVYDALGRRKEEIVDPDGLALKTSYTYNDNDQVVARTDAKDQVTRYVYDAENRLAYTVDATGAVTYNQYDKAGRLTRTTAYANKVTIGTGNKELKASDILITGTDADQKTGYVYDKDGRRTFGIDALGYITKYEYDKAGNVIQQTRYYNLPSTNAQESADGAFLALSAPVPNANGDKDQVTRTVYDKANRAIWTIDALNGVTGRAYDKAGHVTRLTQYATQLITLSADRATVPSDEKVISGTGLNVGDLVVKISEAKDRITVYQYDAAGRQITQIFDPYDAVYTGGVTHASTYVSTLYDAKGNAVLRTDEAGNSTRYVYDDADRLVYTADAAGSITKTQYDAAGRVTETSHHANAVAKDQGLRIGHVPNTNNSASINLGAFNTGDVVTATVLFKADADTSGRIFLGNIAAGAGVAYDNMQVEQKVGSRDTSDGWQRLTVTVTLSGPRELYVYIYGDSGNYANAANSVLYDKLEIKVNGATRTVRTFDQDTLDYDWVISGAVSLNGYTYYGKDVSKTGALAQLGDSDLAALATTANRDRKDTYAYDTAGRLIREVKAAGANEQSTTLYVLDKLGQREQIIDPRGVELAEGDTQWARDMRQQLIQQTGIPPYSGDSLSAYQQLLKRYATMQAFDGNGRVTKRTDALNGVTETTYDAFGNAVRIKDPNNNTGYFVFDNLNRATWQIDPMGYATQTDYNSLGEVDLIVKYANAVHDVQEMWLDAPRSSTEAPVAFDSQDYFDAFNSFFYGGQITASIKAYVIGDSKDAITKIEHDKLGRQTKITDAEDYFESMAYDALGNKTGYTAKSNKNKGSSAAQAGGQYSYEYDRRGNLTQETLPEKVYQYNTDGTRKTESMNATTGEPTSVVVNKYEYDSRGNRTKSIEAYGLQEQRSTSFKYDALNRQIEQRGDAMDVFTTETATFVATSNVNITGTTVTKNTNANSAWEAASVRSTQGYVGGASVSFSPGQANNTHVMVGLNTDPTSNDNYDTIDWALYCDNSTIRVYNNGQKVADSFNYSTSDTLTVCYDGRYIRFFQNSVEIFTREVEITQPLYADTAFHTAGASINNLRFGPTTIVNGNATNKVVPTETRQYDARGNLIEVKAADGGRTLSYYDALNRKVREVSPTGTLTVFTYDKAGNMLTQRVYGVAIALPTTPGGNVPEPLAANADNYRETVFTYDANGRQETSTIASIQIGEINTATGNFELRVQDLVTRKKYDRAGNVIAETDARGNTTWYIYDKLGQPQFKIDAERYVTAWTRDSGGNVLSEKRYANALPASTVLDTTTTASAIQDALVGSTFRETTYVYDRMGRVTSKTIEDVKAATVNGKNVTEQTLDATTSFKYNGQGQIIEQAEPTTEVLNWEYDAMGRQTAILGAAFTDFAGNANKRQTINIEYNALGLASRRIERATTPGSTDRITFNQYGANGLVAQERDATGVLTWFSYDAAGRVTLKRLSRQTANSANTGTVSDTDSQTQTDIIAYTYDLSGRQAKQVTYNVSGYKAALPTAPTAAQTIQSIQLQYDAFGGITGKKTWGGLNAPQVWQEITIYDNAGRAIKSNAGTGSTKGYVFDANGNSTLQLSSRGTDLTFLTIQEMLSQSTLEASTYNANNRLASSVSLNRSNITENSFANNTYSNNSNLIFIGNIQNSQNANQIIKLDAISISKPGQLDISLADSSYPVGNFSPGWWNTKISFSNLGEHLGSGNIKLKIKYEAIQVEYISEDGQYTLFPYVSATLTREQITQQSNGTIDMPWLETHLYKEGWQLSGLPIWGNWILKATATVFKATDVGDIQLGSVSTHSEPIIYLNSWDEYKFPFINDDGAFKAVSYSSSVSILEKKIYFKNQSIDAENLQLVYRNKTGTDSPWFKASANKLVVDGKTVPGWFSFDWSNLGSALYEFQYIALDKNGVALNAQEGSFDLRGAVPSILQSQNEWNKSPQAILTSSVFLGKKIEFLQLGDKAKSAQIQIRPRNDATPWANIAPTTLTTGALGVSMAGAFSMNATTWINGSGIYDYLITTFDANNQKLSTAVGNFEAGNVNSVNTGSPVPTSKLPTTVHFQNLSSTGTFARLSYRTSATSSASAGSWVFGSVAQVSPGSFDWDAMTAAPNSVQSYGLDYRLEVFDANGLLVNHLGGNVTVGATRSASAATSLMPPSGSLDLNPQIATASSVKLHFRPVGSSSDFQLTTTVVPSVVSGGDATFRALDLLAYAKQLNLMPEDGTTEFEYYYEVRNSSSTLLAGSGWPQTPGRFRLSSASQNSAASSTVILGFVDPAKASRTTQQFNAFGEVISQTDANGNTTTFEYNTAGNLSKKIEAKVWATAENGYKSEHTPTTQYYHDLQGRLVGTRDANDYLSTQTWTAEGADGRSREWQTYSADGGVKTNAYDEFGDLRAVTTLVQSTTVTGSVVSSFKYDDNHRLVEVKHPKRSDQTYASIDSYVYDAAGSRIVHTSSADGTTTLKDKTFFDALGRVIRTDSAFGRTTITTYSWDKNTLGLTGTAIGGWTTTTTNSINAENTARNVLPIAMVDKKDFFGHLMSHTDQGGHVFNYSYNAAGWLTDQKSKDSATASQNSGQDIHYEYYADGKVKAIIDNNPLARTQTLYGYDDNGNKTYEGYATQTNGFWNFYQQSIIRYDALNRVIAIDDPQNRIRYEYDKVGNRRRVTAYAGTSTTATQDFWYTYDNMNRFTLTMGKLLNANGDVVAANGEVQSGDNNQIKLGTIGQSNSAVALTYDKAGQRASAQYGTDGRLEKYDFTEDGFLRNVKFVLGNKEWTAAERTIDLLGRVKSYVEYSDVNKRKGSQTFEYDEDGRVKSSVSTTNQDDGKVTTAKTTNTLFGDGTLSTSTTSSSVSDKPSQITTTNTTYTYEWWDAAQQSLISQTQSGIPGAGESRFTYDVNGHVNSVVDVKAGRNLRYVNNAQGLIMRRDEIGANNTVNKFQNYFYFDGNRVGETGNNAGPSQVDYAQALAASTKVDRKQAYKVVQPIRSNFDQNYQAINASYPGFSSTGYVVRSDSERLPDIAQAVWGDSTLWYLIADANGLSADTALKVGQNLVIPNKVANVHNNSTTRAVYNAGEAMGDTSPTLPDPPPPPKKGCGGLGMVLMVVVAVAAFAIVGPLAAGFLQGAAGAMAVSLGASATMAAVASTVGYIAGYAVAGAVSSIASQATGMITGDVQNFNWSAVATSAVTAAVTQGMAMGMDGAANGVINTISTYTTLSPAVIQAMAVNVASQQVLRATGLQKGKFSWLSVAAAGVGAGVRNSVGNWLDDSMSEDFLGMGKNATDVVRNTLSGVASGWASAQVRHDDIHMQAIAGNAFGSALGDAVVGSIQRADSQKTPAISENGDDAVARSELRYGKPDSTKFDLPNVDPSMPFGPSDDPVVKKNLAELDSSLNPSPTLGDDELLAAGPGYSGLGKRSATSVDVRGGPNTFGKFPSAGPGMTSFQKDLAGFALDIPKLPYNLAVNTAEAGMNLLGGGALPGYPDYVPVLDPLKLPYNSPVSEYAEFGLGLTLGGFARSAPDTVTVYRVEGAGNQRLLIDGAGNVEVPQVLSNKGRGPERNLYLNFGDESRAQQFLQQRLEQFPDNTIKSFEVPKSFADELKATAVKESQRATNPTKPVIADPTKASNQYGLSQQQIEQLRKVIIPGTGKQARPGG